MKVFLSKIFGKLFAIGQDRYMHVSAGSLIACISCVIFCWLPLWVNILDSLLLVLSAALIKDLVIDSAPDWLDIVCTVIGGVFVWLPLIVLFWLW